MSALPDRRTTLRALLLGSSSLVAGLLQACASSPPPMSVGTTGSIEPRPSAPERSTPASSPMAQVALLLPLSGGAQIAAVGHALKQAAELANGTSAAPTVQLTVIDDKGTEPGARAAAEQAVKAGAELIIGPLFSKSTKAVAAVARAAHVPVVAFSNDPGAAAPGVYMLGASQASEVHRAVAFVAAQGRRRFAALLPADAEGRLLEPAFRAAVARAGGTVAAVESYRIESNGLVDLPRAHRESLRAPLDALFLPAGQDTLPQLVSVLNHVGLDWGSVRLIGSSGWDYPHVGRQSRLIGAVFAAPEPRGWQDFAEKFGKTYQAMPPRIATLPHDAVLLAASLAGTAAKGTRFTPEYMTRSAGFNGADGAFRLESSGQVQRSLAILEVQRGGPIVVDASAPVVVGAQAAGRSDAARAIN